MASKKSIRKIIWLIIGIIVIIYIFTFQYVYTINKTIIWKNNNEGMKTNIIPLHIYQFWHSVSLPPKMKECVENLKRDNPEFQYYLYNIETARDFIKNNYNDDVLDAFDNLKPYAYKCDLWRYCILYKNGGLYLDIKFQCENGFKLIKLTEKEHYILDQPYGNKGEIITLEDELKMVSSSEYHNNIFSVMDYERWKDGKIGIINGIIVSKPNNPIMLNCIQQIVKNVKNKYYGNTPLDVSGPGLLGSLYFNGDYSKIKEFEYFNSVNGTYIISKNKIVISQYNEYRNEQKQHSNNKYYAELWNERSIYE